LLKHVRREHFVPVEKKGLAFADRKSRWVMGTCSSPNWKRAPFRNCISPAMTGIEVGTGSGCCRTVRAGGHVTSVEIVPGGRHGGKSGRLSRDNITIETGDGAHG
jgi:protein-L-isoaspartate O-methyltransferase